jgi:putative pyruvate formate lyase activating enzyme
VAVTPERLREIYFSLIAQGVHNINLVTATHFAEPVLASLAGGLPVPVVWNSGGYERPETVDMLAPFVQIWLPDMKYALAAPAARYSRAPDYPETAKAAILRMYDRTGPYVMGEDGLLRSGVIIRHLVLPGQLENTRRVIDYVARRFAPGEVKFSLMSQYTPQPGATGAMARRLTGAEYRAARDYMAACGIDDGFCQERSSAKEEYTPDFDLSGV